MTMHSTAVLEVIRAGLHTTVQDGGRWGHQHLGVPVGGALDLPALHRANRLVGNAPDDAGLEFTLVGGVLRAQQAACIAVTGARIEVRVDGRAVEQDRAHWVDAGAHVEVGPVRRGARPYLAVRGGIDVPVLLGSRSAWPFAPRRGALADGDRLPIGARVVSRPFGGPLPSPVYGTDVRVLFTSEAEGVPDVVDALCGRPYRIRASASRMAYPLEGAAVPLQAPDRVSSGTVAGAIQIVPSGAPVILLAERQTTGGYPVAAVVIGADLMHLAQLAPGDQLRLVPTTRAEALRALWEQDASWRTE